MADRHRERVCRVVRRRQRVEPEQQLDHLLDLVLLRAAEPDDRSLDFCRRVLDDRKPGLRCRQQRDAARMPELQRTAHVARVEDGSRPPHSQAGAAASSATRSVWMCFSLSGNVERAGAEIDPQMTRW